MRADNVGGTRAAVVHLLRQGHRRIGYIGDAAEIFTAAQRLRGYRDELVDSGLPFDESLVAMGHPEPKFVHAALDRMLAGPEPATALIAGNNPAVQDTLGSILIDKGDSKRAVELLQKAVTSLPENGDMQLHLAQAQVKSGDKANARKTLEKLSAANKGDASAKAAALLQQM